MILSIKRIPVDFFAMLVADLFSSSSTRKEKESNPSRTLSCFRSSPGTNLKVLVLFILP